MKGKAPGQLSCPFYQEVGSFSGSCTQETSTCSALDCTGSYDHTAAGESGKVFLVDTLQSQTESVARRKGESMPGKHLPESATSCKPTGTALSWASGSPLSPSRFYLFSLQGPSSSSPAHAELYFLNTELSELPEASGSSRVAPPFAEELKGPENDLLKITLLW